MVPVTALFDLEQLPSSLCVQSRQNCLKICLLFYKQYKCFILIHLFTRRRCWKVNIFQLNEIRDQWSKPGFPMFVFLYYLAYLFGKSKTFIYGGALFTFGGESIPLPYSPYLCQPRQLGYTPNDTELCLCIAQPCTLLVVPDPGLDQLEQIHPWLACLQLIYSWHSL